MLLAGILCLLPPPSSGGAINHHRRRRRREFLGAPNIDLVTWPKLTDVCGMCAGRYARPVPTSQWRVRVLELPVDRRRVLVAVVVVFAQYGAN